MAPASESKVTSMPERAMANAIEMASLLLRLMSMRLLTVVSMAGSIGMFAWAMTYADVIHLCVACAYTVLVFLPVLAKESKE